MALRDLVDIETQDSEASRLQQGALVRPDPGRQPRSALEDWRGPGMEIQDIPADVWLRHSEISELVWRARSVRCV